MYPSEEDKEIDLGNDDAERMGEQEKGKEAHEYEERVWEEEEEGERYEEQRLSGRGEKTSERMIRRERRGGEIVAQARASE
jgi:hypothetical protein